MSQAPGSGTPIRAPGSFSPVVQLGAGVGTGAGAGAGVAAGTSSSSTAQQRRLIIPPAEDSSEEEPRHLSVARQRAAVQPQQQNQPHLQHQSVQNQQNQQHQNIQSATPSPRAPLYVSPALANSSSTTSLPNFSRPTPTPLRTDLPSALSPNSATRTPESARGHHGYGHGRKNSHTQGSFEPYLPSSSYSNMGAMGNGNLDKALSASQIAAQAAMQHQTQQSRQGSLARGSPLVDAASYNPGAARGQQQQPAQLQPQQARGPASPPVLSLTEASVPRDAGFGGQGYHNGLLGGGAAQTAANVVFPKSPSASPGLPPTEYEAFRAQSEKPKAEKPKVKLFSRPARIGISKDKEAKAGALPSPSKASYSLGSLARGNMSTNSLVDNSMSSAASMYSMANSSTATLRAEPQEREREKEKKHHFLSRQKHKLSSKDDHHLPLSSASSNSKPVDPSAPSSLYNFSLPPSPGPGSTTFGKSMSGLDLRHGGRALREKKKEASEASNELSYQNSNEWPGPSSLGSAGASYLGSGPGSYPGSLADSQDLSKFGLSNMTPDDAWPFLKARLLVIFEGEDLRVTVEDFNWLVLTHFQRCFQKRSPNLIIDDLRDLLTTGFSALDHTLRRTPDERLIPRLVEMWLFTFTSILPYMQAVFLPLDKEFTGNGAVMTEDQAREFWGGLPSFSGSGNSSSVPASQVLEVRRIVLIAYRDTVILPRYETLKTIFSRLSLESISLNLPSADTLSTSPDSFSNISGGRPSTAMSLDPSNASYGSQSTTLLGGPGSGDGSGNRSRAISNVSHGSDSILSGLGINVPPPPRPFTPSSTHPFGQGGGGGIGHSASSRVLRDRTVEDGSNRLTETVGRMLQCVSVLASVGGAAGTSEDDNQRKMDELCRGLKLNWLGRGRTGRNRRGLVGARVPGGSRGQESRPEGIVV